MHFGLVGSYWWVILLAFLAVFVGYVLFAGRNATGGLGNRTSLGWSRWRELSRKAAEVQARVVLSVFYFTLAAPFGIARSLLGDPLRIRRDRQTRAWLKRETHDRTLEDARKQF